MARVDLGRTDVTESILVRPAGFPSPVCKLQAHRVDGCLLASECTYEQVSKSGRESAPQHSATLPHFYSPSVRSDKRPSRYDPMLYEADEDSDDYKSFVSSSRSSVNSISSMRSVGQTLSAPINRSLEKLQHIAQSMKDLCGPKTPLKACG